MLSLQQLWMVRGLGLKLVNDVTSFTDVNTTDWYSGAIQTLYEYKLIISQAMVVTKLKSKLPSKATRELLNSFIDEDIAAEWAKSSIAEADTIKLGIISSKSSTFLAPKAPITRAEVRPSLFIPPKKENFLISISQSYL